MPGVRAKELSQIMSTPKTADEKPRRSWWPFGGSTEKVEQEEDLDERGLTAPKGRATPGRRSTTTSDGNAVVRSVGGIRENFEGVQEELRKVTWPTRQEAIRLSTIVLITTVLSSLALGLIALTYSELFRLGLDQPALFLGFFVLVLVIGFILYRRSNSNTSAY
jgi:preprotein translocase SecE subunit